MKKYIILLTCISYCAICFAQSSLDLIIKANDLYKQGMYDEAIAVLDEEIKKEEINLNARYARSFLYHHLGNNEMALSDINVVLKYEPSNLKAYHMRAAIYKELNENEKALNDVNKVLEYFPNESLSLTLRGCIYQNMNKRGEALSDFDDAISFAKSDDKNIYGYYYNRAYYYFKMESFNYAMNDIEKALNYNPTDYRCLVLKSRILNDFDKTDSALETINLALMLYPQKRELNYLRINYYLDAKKTDLAKNELDKLKQDGIDSANYHFLMAKFYACLNDRQNAIKELELFSQTKQNSMEKVMFEAKIRVEDGPQINLDDFNLSDLY